MNDLCGPERQDIIVVGATGDLSRRKLLPALYNLYLEDALPAVGAIAGYARSDLDDEQFRALAAAAVREFSRRPLDEQAWEGFASRLTYIRAKDGFASLKHRCCEGTRLIYLAIPPSAFAATVKEIGEAGLADGSRLLVEKPFGHDLESSRRLDDVIHGVFDESQVFRIDHYLGKETVQNILVFRFGNSVFERVWNRDSIDHIQLTVAESLGIEGRGNFYEETGALRDILQSHVLQVLSLIAMEPPVAFNGQAIRDEKAQLLTSIRPVQPEDVVRGQYTAGAVDGRRVPGYREEEGVAPDSSTETFAALRLFIDNWRWAGVPFYLRTGKRMPRRTTEVAVVFREAPVMFFKETPVERLKPNMLNILIQPNEQIRFQFIAKVPGAEVEVEPVDMHFSYEESFKTQPAEAYERLLHDAMCGEPMLFLRADSVHNAWQVIEAVLDHEPPALPYEAGTWGPDAATTLIAPRLWHPR
ncbi:MAG: glucose-6-phosphate dehydrogenase [Dehalococcoidia bacterium]